VTGTEIIKNAESAVATAKLVAIILIALRTFIVPLFPNVSDLQ
jgi:hypothetical protein